MNKIEYVIALAELNKHPFTTTARFPLLDNKPNGNNWLITEEEFDNIANTAVGMPVKMSFDGAELQGHPGAVPIGVIRNVFKEELPDGTKRLVAEATLWNDEYPEGIQWLWDKFESAQAGQGEAPGISYEMGYTESTMDGLIKRFKNTVAMAATFVKAPSYGTRTRLLALASLEEEDRNTQLMELAETIVAAKPTNKGGNRMDEKELEELKRAHASQLEALQAQITTVTSERDAVVQEKETLVQQVAELQKEALVGTRLHQYAEAGLVVADDEKEVKKELFASFTEAQWTSYLADITKVKKAAPKSDQPTNVLLASLQKNDVPKLDVEITETSLGELKNAMRGLARPHAVSE